MKNACKIEIVAIVDGKQVMTKTTDSKSRMWVENKAIFAEHPTAILEITKDGEQFMRLHLERKSNGKDWMKNDIVESRKKPSKSKADAQDSTEGSTKVKKTKIKPEAQGSTEPEIEWNVGN